MDKLRVAPGPKRPLRGQKVTFPNGMAFYGMSRFELALMYREVFEQRTYLKGVKTSAKMTIVDVGANCGMTSLFFSKNFPDSTIFSFEPISYNYSNLRRNLEEHGAKNIHAFECGLSSQEVEVEFNFYPYASGCSTLYPIHTDEFYSVLKSDIQNHDRLPVLLKYAFKVPGVRWLVTKLIIHFKMRAERVKGKLRTLSSFIEEQEISKIDLLKVDAERSELEVLRGIKEEHWPRISQAIVEVQTDFDSQMCEKVQHLLNSKGFETRYEECFYLIKKDGTSLNKTVYATRDARQSTPRRKTLPR